MTITIENLQRTVPLNPARIRSLARKILKSEGVRRCELSLVFVTSQRMRALNRQFLKKDHVTDVLSFDYSDGKARGTLKGEVVICAPVAERNAKSFGTTVQKELALYVIHGILHLLGYDDHRAADIRKMRRREVELMKVLG